MLKDVGKYEQREAGFTLEGGEGDHTAPDRSSELFRAHSTGGYPGSYLKTAESYWSGAKRPTAQTESGALITIDAGIKAIFRSTHGRSAGRSRLPGARLGRGRPPLCGILVSVGLKQRYGRR